MSLDLLFWAASANPNADAAVLGAYPFLFCGASANPSPKKSRRNGATDSLAPAAPSVTASPPPESASHRQSTASMAAPSAASGSAPHRIVNCGQRAASAMGIGKSKVSESPLAASAISSSSGAQCRRRCRSGRVRRRTSTWRPRKVEGSPPFRLLAAFAALGCSSKPASSS